MVNVAFKAGLATGGSDEEISSLRPHYGDGDYGAYLRDSDRNMIHIVYRGDKVGNNVGN